MSHDFWLFREGERTYDDYRDLLARRDAPIRLDDHLLAYFGDSLIWIPTLNPTQGDIPGYGLNWFGPTIVNETGGLALQQVCLAWKQLFACGPAQLRLRVCYTLTWPFEEKEHILDPTQLDQLGEYEYVEVERDWLVETFATLAQFGAQVATGEYFLLHLGI